MTKIGVLLPTREAVIYGDQTGDPRPLVDLAVMAEELGFDSVWAGDSLLAKPRADPLTLLAAVATVTERVELGTAVLLPSLRNPEQLAQATATVDALSGGRFILGLGAGPGTNGVRVDHDFVGVDFDNRASRSVIVAERVRDLWRGTGPDGEQMYPLPGTPGGPPIWYGGNGPRTLARAGAHFDGWFPTATSPEAFAAGLAAVRKAASKAGRRPDAVSANAYLTVAVGTPEQAQAELAEHSLRYYGVPHEVVASQQGSVAGTEETVADWLGSFIDHGAEHLCVRIGSKNAVDQVRILAGLLPRLRG